MENKKKELIDFINEHFDSEINGLITYDKRDYGNIKNVHYGSKENFINNIERNFNNDLEGSYVKNEQLTIISWKKQDIIV